MARFVVVRTEGFLINPASHGSGPRGVTFSVLDSAVCCRLYGERRASMSPRSIETAEKAARALADRLERECVRSVAA